MAEPGSSRSRPMCIGWIEELALPACLWVEVNFDSWPIIERPGDECQKFQTVPPQFHNNISGAKQQMFQIMSEIGGKRGYAGAWGSSLTTRTIFLAL